jgi:NitT/TauT family transport system permease protein
VVARVGLPLAALALLVAVWQSYASRSGNFLMPRPVRFVKAIPDVLGSGAAWGALGTSDVSLLLGYGIAVLAGVPLGLAMARSRVVDRVMGPYLDIAIVVPMAVMMPVVLMALGLTRRAQVAVIVLFAVPFIVVATRDGARTLRAEWTEMARVFGAGELQLWRRVMLPGSVGAIVAGLRLGFAQALTGLVTVELTLIALGIGKQMIVYQSHFQSAQLFVFVALLMAQSVAFLSVLRLLERRVSRGGRAG